MRVLLASVLLAAAVSNGFAAERPNIILGMTDDTY
jgi:hypothetical protein